MGFVPVEQGFDNLLLHEYCLCDNGITPTVTRKEAYRPDVLRLSVGPLQICAIDCYKGHNFQAAFGVTCRTAFACHLRKAWPLDIDAGEAATVYKDGFLKCNVQRPKLGSAIYIVLEAPTK